MSDPASFLVAQEVCAAFTPERAADANDDSEQRLNLASEFIVYFGKVNPMSARKPEKVFRIGFVSASVFFHEIDTDDGKRTLRSVNLQKRYLDGEEVKYTSSFNLAELLQAIRVLQLAPEYVESCESQVALSE